MTQDAKTSPESYRLVRVTDKDLIDFTRKKNSVSWKAILSNDDYVLREYVLGKCPMTAELYVFMLKDQSEAYLSSIELLVRPAYKYVLENGAVKRLSVKSGCIGGVYANPDYRGQGLGTIMTNKLLEVSKEKYVGPDGFTFLYSEVGEYYSRMGFKSMHVPIVNIDVGETVTYPEMSTEDFALKDGETVKFIGYNDFQEVFEVYKQADDKRIRDLVAQDGKTRVTIVPSADNCDWFHLRAKFISYKLFHQGTCNPIDFEANYSNINKSLEELNPRVFGLTLTSAHGELIGFIVWTFDYSHEDNKFSNLCTVIQTFVDPKFDQGTYTEKLIELLRNYLIVLNKAQNCPSTSNFHKLKVWQCEFKRSKSISKFGGYVTENPSLSALQPHDSLENSRMVEGNLIWENNSKLPWF